jgi:hypothetical protein
LNPNLSENPLNKYFMRDMYYMKETGAWYQLSGLGSETGRDILDGSL